MVGEVEHPSLLVIRMTFLRFFSLWFVFLSLTCRSLLYAGHLNASHMLCVCACLLSRFMLSFAVCCVVRLAVVITDLWECPFPLGPPPYETGVLTRVKQ